MRAKRRFDLLLAYWSRDREIECSFAEVLGKVIRPTSGTLARRMIAGIEDDGEFRVVRLRDGMSPFYWPKSVSLEHLHIVVTESLYKDDWHYYQVPETMVERGDIVLDCGAAEGLFSLQVADRAHCVAIEPAAAFVECLNRTFLGMDSVEIVPCALGEREGMARFRGGALNSSLFGPAIHEHTGVDSLVQVDTIDNLVKRLNLRRVDYIKGDLESSEMDTLRGAVNTIREHRPKIALTAYHEGNDWKEIVRFVQSLVPDYRWRTKGLSRCRGSVKPVMVHLWSRRGKT